jgi:hypothetical protein
MLGRDREALEAYRGVVSGAAAQDNLRVLVQARQRELSSPQAEPVPQSTTQPAPAEMDTGEEEVTPTAPSGV